MKRRRTWWIVGVIALAAVVGGGLWLRSRTKKEAPKFEGEIIAVERASVRRTVSADGTLRALTTVEVKSYAGGNVEVLAVDVGDRVQKGDLIAEIDPTDSQTTHTQAQADLTVAVANLTQARANLAVQNTLTSADIALARASHAGADDDLVKLLDATQPQTRSTATATLDQAAAALEVAVKELERLRVADQPQELASAQAELDSAVAALEASQKDLERLQGATQPQAVASARASVDKGEASVESARKNLERLRQAGHPQASAQTQSNLAKARTDLDVAWKELERSRGLRAEGLVSQSELEAAVSTYESRKAEFDYAEEVASTIGSDQAGEIRSAEMTLAQAEADLASARERWATIDQEQSTEARAAEAKVTQARATLDAARSRWATIGDQHTAALRVAEAKVRQAQADLEAAQQRWNTLDKEQSAERQSAESRVQEAQASLDKAEAGKVDRQLREADVQSARAQVEKAQAAVMNAATMLGYTTIVAPRDGIILQRYVEEGTIVTSGRSSVTEGTSLVQLGDLSQVFVDVQVDESDLGSIFVDQAVDIHIEAFEDETFEGVVTRVDPQAVTETNVTTVLIEVEVQEPDARLLPGLTSSCDFLVEEAQDALSVPRRAVTETEDGATVTVMENGVGTPTPVTIGVQGDERTEILDGVAEGAQVLLPRLGSATGPATAENRGREMGRRMGGGGFATKSG